MRACLLLNRSEEVIDVISWRRGVTLLAQGKVECPWPDVETHEVKTVSGVFKLPSVLILVEYVRLPFKRAAITKENVLRRDKHTCQYCGKTVTSNTVTVDHVTPLSRGGKHEWTNIVAACQRCNNRKNDLTPSEFEKRHGYKLRTQPHAPTRLAIVLSAVSTRGEVTWSRWLKLCDV